MALDNLFYQGVKRKSKMPQIRFRDVSKRIGMKDALRLFLEVAEGLEEKAGKYAAETKQTEVFKQQIALAKKIIYTSREFKNTRGTNLAEGRIILIAIELLLAVLKQKRAENLEEVEKDISYYFKP